MKNLLGILLVLVTVSVTKAQSVAVTGETTTPVETISIKESAFDFGSILQGRPVYHSFEVVNKGKQSLEIRNVQTSCGCTTPEWSREPVAPGASSIIKVGYNAAAEGPFTKSITIVYNDNQTKNITISGTVYKAPTTSAPLNSSVSLLKQKNR